MKFNPKGEMRRTSPLTHRFQILEDEETGWGRDIRQLMGVYRKQHDGTYCLDDIRKTDFTPLTTYPKTTFRVGPLPLRKPIEGLEEGQYCVFSWKFTFNVKVNPCEICVDESKPIVFVSPKDFISAMSKASPVEPQNDTTPKGKAVAKKNAVKRQTDVCVLIYDLLFEANKYVGKPVDVQVSLTDKYLSFQHTGRRLSAETILWLCRDEVPVDDESVDNSVSFHCKGLREFLLANDHTIVVSNGFTIRFDNVGGQLRVVWLDRSDLPRELKISLARNKRFTETIILPFNKKDSSVQNNYKVGLHCVFDDVQNIAFFANIGKVAVKIKGGKTKTLDRKDWVVSKEYVGFVPKEAREHHITKRHTAIMFACRHKGKSLIGDDESPVYSMLPTTSSFGFPFLMQLDIHINKTNYAINRRDAWNKVYAEIAGRLFAKWITELTQHGDYTPQSIYHLVPKFDECIEQHPEERMFISQFQKGFKAIILKDKEQAAPAAPAKPRENNVKEKPNRKPSVNRAKPVSRTAAVVQPAQNVKQDGKAYQNVQQDGKVYVVDTNIFVNCPDVISRIDDHDTIIISAKVVDELDNLKYKMEDKDLRNVQKALKNINLAIDKGNVRMEMSDVRLLPHDFDRHNPDNNILSVVLRHKAQSPTLITSDNGLQIKAKVLGINVIGLKEFLASHKKKRTRKIAD